MAIPDLEFPTLVDDPVDRIWEALKAILRADRNLKTVRTMRFWEGEPDDAQPPAAGELPWIRVTPTSAPMKWGDEASFLADLTFKYELAVEGTKIRNLFRLFGAFRNAFNLDASVQGSNALQTLQNAGAVIHNFHTGAIGPLKVRDVEPDPMTGMYPVQNLAAVGVFSVRCYISAIS